MYQQQSNKCYENTSGYKNSTINRGQRFSGISMLKHSLIFWLQEIQQVDKKKSLCTELFQITYKMYLLLYQSFLSTVIHFLYDFLKEVCAHKLLEDTEMK